MPHEENKIVLDDLSGHVGRTGEDYSECHGGFGYGVRNDQGEEILQCASAYSLAVVNTYFQKKEEHLITYKVKTSSMVQDRMEERVICTQIDYILCNRDLLRQFVDCKVIPGEPLTSQHRLLIGELLLRFPLNNGVKPTKKIKWFKLRDKETSQPLIDDIGAYIIQDMQGNDNDTPDIMWKRFQQYCTSRAKYHLGVSNGRLKIDKETWWWKSSVQEALKKKKTAFKAWWKEKDNQNGQDLKEEYKAIKKQAKRVVAIAKSEAQRGLYDDLETPEGVQRIYKVAAQRERQSRDIVTTKYIHDDRGTLLTRDKAINNRWKEYFEGLLNEEFPRDRAVSQCPVEGPVPEVTPSNIAVAVSRMKNNKSVGPDDIPAELWKALGAEGNEWLTKLFNKILAGFPMPEQFRQSFLVPIYKQKGDVRECENYRGIKLTSHTLKIWERVIRDCIKGLINIHRNQCGFTSDMSTSDAIQTLRILIEKHRELRKDLHMVFIDLEKAFDRVPRDIVWAALRHQHVPEVYVKMIQDMYLCPSTMVKTTAGVSDGFRVDVGVHQGSALSPALFNIVINYLTEQLMTDLPWTILYADDIVLVGESCQEVEAVLERWRTSLESNGLRISRKKTEYMFFNFAQPGQSGPHNTVFLAGEPLMMTDKFKYLGSVITTDGNIDEDVKHRISVGWMKWRSLTGALCDKRMSIKLKGKVYKTTVRPALMYGSECWARQKKHDQRMHVTEMRMLRWSAGVTQGDKVRNEHVRGSSSDKMEEKQLRRYGDVRRRNEYHLVQKALAIEEPKRGRGRPKATWLP